MKVQGGLTHAITIDRDSVMWAAIIIAIAAIIVAIVKSLLRSKIG